MGMGLTNSHHYLLEIVEILPYCITNVRNLSTKYVTNRKACVAYGIFTNYLKALDDKMRS
jgi:hypothetical protein